MWETGSLTRVISGGQTGADLAALYAAYYVGIPSGGRAPRGYMTEVGPRPKELQLLGLQETISTKSYVPRTILNIKHSDATLILVRHDYTPGTVLTATQCRVMKKPYLLVQSNGDFFEHLDIVCEWLERTFPVTLNCAGNRLSVAGTNFESVVFAFLCEVFSLHLGIRRIEPQPFQEYRNNLLRKHQIRENLS